MQKFHDIVLRSDGRPAIGARVTVTTSSGAAATLYSGNGTGALPNNTVLTDSSGEYSFYAENGRYNISIAYGGFTTENKTDVVLFDMTDLANQADAAKGSALVGFVQGGSGAAGRSVRDKLRDFVSVKDFGATGDGVTNDATAIQAAIDAVHAAGGGTVVFPGAATYLCNAAITQPASVLVDLGAATIDGKNVTTAALWTITAGGDIRQIRKVLRGGVLKGVESPTDGVYSATTHGLRFQTSQIEVDGVALLGFQSALYFDSNSYVARVTNCSVWYSRRAWDADQTSKTGMGADLQAVGSLFAHNDHNVYNNLCESTFRDCAFDAFRRSVVEANVNASGGSYNSFLLFDDCRFERGGDATLPWFSNAGYLILKNPKFFEPFTYSYLFDNSGVIDLEGGFSRLATSAYSSRNTGAGTINVYGVRPVDFNGECFRLSPAESGVYNGDFELGTTAGWVVTTGSAANMTVSADAHLGSWSLQFVSDGIGAFDAESWPIPIRAGSRKLLLNLYAKNLNASTVYPTLRFYTATGTQISSAYEGLAANTLAWTRLRFVGDVPAGAAYAKLTINLGIPETSGVRFDDIYTNQA